jgi:hypothetical protein
MFDFFRRQTGCLDNHRGRNAHHFQFPRRLCGFFCFAFGESMIKNEPADTLIVQKTMKNQSVKQPSVIGIDIAKETQTIRCRKAARTT